MNNLIAVRLDNESMKDLLLLAQTTERSRSAVMRILIKTAAHQLNNIPDTQQKEEQFESFEKLHSHKEKIEVVNHVS